MVSVVVYIPMRVITPAHRCVPFVLVFLGQGQSELAGAAIFILSSLLILLVMGILILGFDSGMLKRDPKILSDVDLNSQQKLNPDRMLVYYGATIFVQYVVPINISY